MDAAEPYDMLLKGGRVVDPDSGLDGVADIAIRGGRIAAVHPDILAGPARQVADLRGRIVLPGMIVTHAHVHVYTYVSGRFGLLVDTAGVESGATTLVDQGGASCMTFPGFRKFIAEPAESQVLSFISAYVVGGLEGYYYPALYGPHGVDVGHGSHFSFRMARLALEAGLVPDTLGPDMHGYNTKVPPPAGTPAAHPDDEEARPFAGNARFSLTHAMTELLALGLALPQVVPMVTTNAAAMLDMEGEIGTHRPGAVADVSVLSDERGRFRFRFRFRDNEGTEVVGNRLLRPLFCLRAGVRHDAVAPILPQAEAA